MWQTWSVSRRHQHMQYSPRPLGREQVVLHLVFEWDQRSDGIEQRQALGFVDDQLQVPNEHG